jgi:hypothetical protein
LLFRDEVGSGGSAGETSHQSVNCLRPSLGFDQMIKRALQFGHFGNNLTHRAFVLPPTGHVVVAPGSETVSHDRCVDSCVGYFVRLCGISLFIGGVYV